MTSVAVAEDRTLPVRSGALRVLTPLRSPKFSKTLLQHDSRAIRLANKYFVVWKFHITRELVVGVPSCYFSNLL